MLAEIRPSPMKVSLVVVSTLTLLVIPPVQTAPPQTTTGQTVSGQPQDMTDDFEIVFTGNRVLRFSQSLLERFFLSLCDSRTERSHLRVVPADDGVGDDHRPGRSSQVESVISDVKQTGRPELTKHYACDLTGTSSPGLITCTTAANDSSSAVGADTARELVFTGSRFQTVCDFTHITLSWSSDVEDFNFGRDPFPTEGNQICLRFSGNKVYSDCNIVESRVSEGEKKNEEGEDFGSGVESYSVNRQVSAKQDGTETVGVTGSTNNKGGADDENDASKRNAFFFQVGFYVSVVVNGVLLLLCVYLCICGRRKAGESLQTLAPEAGAQRRARPVRGRKGDAVTESVAYIYQDIEDEVMKLQVRVNGGYLSDSELPSCSVRGKLNSNDSGEARDGSPGKDHNVSSSTSGRSPHPDRVDSVDSSLGQRSAHSTSSQGTAGVSSSAASTSFGDYHLQRPVDQASEAETETEAGNVNIERREPRPGSVMKRTEIISALLKAKFDPRPRFFTSAADGSDPRNQGQSKQTPQTPERHSGGEVAKACGSDVTSGPAKAAAGKKPTPRKPRQSRKPKRKPPPGPPTDDSPGKPKSATFPPSDVTPGKPKSVMFPPSDVTPGKPKSVMFVSPLQGETDDPIYENQQVCASALRGKNKHKDEEEGASAIYSNM